MLSGPEKRQPERQGHNQELLLEIQPQPGSLPSGTHFPCTHFANVGVIQGSIDLIQNEEGGWFVAGKEPVSELTLIKMGRATKIGLDRPRTHVSFPLHSFRD